MSIDEFMRDIAPKMKQGWVAMDKDGRYFYYKNIPSLGRGMAIWIVQGFIQPLDIFDIEPVDNWRKSLRKVGNDE